MSNDDPLPPESRAVLDGLASGLTLGAVAARLHISRRTADRRLAQARHALGVTTTAEAVALVSSPGHPGASATDLPPLVGRDRDVAAVSADLTADRGVLLVGEGGVGKTSILRAVVAAEGRTAYVSVADRSARWTAYAPLIQALGTQVAGDVEAVSAQVEAIVGPGLLVVDDLHRADRATLEVLRALLGRVAVLAAARDDVGGNGSDVVASLGTAGCTVHRVKPLDDECATRLARAIAPALGPGRIEEIVAGAGGLPLLVEHLCGAGPDIPTDRGLVPSLDALSPRALADAVVLAVAESSRSVATADELVAARLAVPDSAGLLKLRHQLVADAVLAAADADVITDAHRQLARVSEEPAVAARHWAAAGDRPRALAISLAAAELAGSPGERAHLLVQAAECCDGEPAAALWLRAASAASAAGMFDLTTSAADKVDATALSIEELGQLSLVRARSAWHHGAAADAVAHCRAGLATLGDLESTATAMLLVESVRCEVLSTGIAEDHDDRLARASRIIGSGPGRGLLLNVAAILPYLRTGTGLEEWLAGLAAAREEGDHDTAMRCANNIVMWHESSGDQMASLELAMTMADEARALGLGSWRHQFTTSAANLLYHQGRYDEALGLLDEVEYAVIDQRTRHQARVVRTAILIDLGMLDAARDQLDPATALTHDWLADDGRFYLRAAWELAAGRPREALRLISDFEAGGRSESSMWMFLLPVRAWAEHDLGLAVTRHDVTSAIPLAVGLLLEAHAVADLAGDPERALATFDEAAQLGRRWSLAQGLRAQWGAAEAARLAQRDDAVARLLEVEQAAGDLGLEPLLIRVHRSLRAAGITRRARRASDRSGVLTERERLVVDLVSSGASYDEIARRLGLGRPTVRRILGNARLKLGAESRLGLVAAVQGR